MLHSLSQQSQGSTRRHMIGIFKKTMVTGNQIRSVDMLKTNGQLQLITFVSVNQDNTAHWITQTSTIAHATVLEQRFN